MSSSTNYLVGSKTRISTAITDCATGLNVDPGGVALKVRPPGAAITTLVYGTDADLGRDGVGLYHADIDLDAAGLWRWRWEASAPNKGAVEGDLTVAASSVV